ncbi:G-protein coupled receptor 15 [Gracilinanus agilis]|uniref:G-protein coupled receptor 15 n=1 Tax=Gracilinanus agilis TaxID=191870 RepID=UPI001CFF405A|nr:G-protein coupled receptor 15 [Gracilinanus agilis]
MDETTPLSYMDNYATSQDLDFEDDHSHVLYTSIILPIFYTVVFLIGVVGNLILMGALHFKRGSQRLIDIFIINLAVSDFIFLVTLPLWVDKEASLGLWRTGSFLCKGSSYIISVNMHSSVFLLTCMSAERYLAIMCPSASRKFRRKNCTYGVCVIVWLVSCLLGLPTVLSRKLTMIEERPYCAEEPATLSKRAWALVSLIFTFFVPLLSILTCYCSIARKLCAHYQRSGKHNKKLRKSIKIIFIVVVAFVSSWLPFNIFKLLSIISGLQEEPFLSSATLQVGMEVSGPLAFSNSCINPFIYYFFDGYIRRAIICCLCPCPKNYNLGSSTETSDSHLSKIFANFTHGEDSSRKRRRSVSL